MRWLAIVPYVIAAAIQLQQSLTPALFLITSLCVLWLGVANVIESRAEAPRPVHRDGWTRALTEPEVESTWNLLQLGFTATWLRHGLTFFGVLILSWTLLLLR